MLNIICSKQALITCLYFYCSSGNHICHGAAAGIAINEDGRGYIVGKLTMVEVTLSVS